MRDEGFVTDACDIPPGTWLRNDVQGLEEAYLWAAQNRGWPSWYEPPRETEFGLLGTWSNRETAPPLTLEGLREGMRAHERLRDEFRGEAILLSPAESRVWSEIGFAQALREIASWEGHQCPCSLCESGQGADNVTDELMALVRQGDEAGFRELAACVMPAGEVAECWAGARARLGLPGPSVPPAGQEIEEIMRPLTEWAEGLQERPFSGRSITERLGEYVYGDRQRMPGCGEVR